MISLVNIARGWFNYIAGDPFTKLLMGKRLAICDGCEEKVEISELGKILIKAINEEGSTFQCRKCGCPLAGKTASPMEECPLKKWGKSEEQSYF